MVYCNAPSCGDSKDTTVTESWASHCTNDHCRNVQEVHRGTYWEQILQFDTILILPFFKKYKCLHERVWNKRPQPGASPEPSAYGQSPHGAPAPAGMSNCSSCWPIERRGPMCSLFWFGERKVKGKMKKEKLYLLYYVFLKFNFNLIFACIS